MCAPTHIVDLSLGSVGHDERLEGFDGINLEKNLPFNIFKDQRSMTTYASELRKKRCSVVGNEDASGFLNQMQSSICIFLKKNYLHNIANHPSRDRRTVGLLSVGIAGVLS